METSIGVRKEGVKFLVDIHIKGMNAMNLSSLHADEIRDMVRPQIESILYDSNDPERCKYFARAIVDGIPLPQSSSPEDESAGSGSSDIVQPPHTEAGS